MGKTQMQRLHKKVDQLSKRGSGRDELCYCGHLKSQHNPTVTPGHGSCAVRPCECAKFTWKAFV